MASSSLYANRRGDDSNIIENDLSKLENIQVIAPKNDDAGGFILSERFGGNLQFKAKSVAVSKPASDSQKNEDRKTVTVEKRESFPQKIDDRKSVMVEKRETLPRRTDDRKPAPIPHKIDDRKPVTVENRESLPQKIDDRRPVTVAKIASLPQNIDEHKLEKVIKSKPPKLDSFEDKLKNPAISFQNANNRISDVLSKMSESIAAPVKFLFLYDGEISFIPNEKYSVDDLMLLISQNVTFNLQRTLSTKVSSEGIYYYIDGMDFEKCLKIFSEKIPTSKRILNNRGIPMADISYQDGKKNGLAMYYFLDIKSADDKPILKSSVYYIHDKKEGTEIVYLPNGYMKEKLNYLNGKLHGPSFQYGDNNKVLVKEFYENGELKSDEFLSQ